MFCECEALATLRHIYLGSFFLDAEDIRGLSLGAIQNFFRQGSHDLDLVRGHRGPVKGLHASGP
jgi:hypothetical protein